MWDSDYTEMLISLDLPSLKKLEESPVKLSVLCKIVNNVAVFPEAQIREAYSG